MAEVYIFGGNKNKVVDIRIYGVCPVSEQQLHVRGKDVQGMEGSIKTRVSDLLDGRTEAKNM